MENLEKFVFVVIDRDGSCLRFVNCSLDVDAACASARSWLSLSPTAAKVLVYDSSSVLVSTVR